MTSPSLRRWALGMTCAATAGIGFGGCQPDAGQTEEAAGGRLAPYRGVALPAPLEKPRFTLTDTEGRPYDFRERTEGDVTLLFFGYTSCPDICPVHLTNLGEVLRSLPGEVRSRVKVVFVSVDPERDAPERIGEWLQAFDRGLDSTFVGLTGTPAQLAAASSCCSAARSSCSSSATSSSDGRGLGKSSRVPPEGRADSLSSRRRAVSVRRGPGGRAACTLIRRAA